MTRIFDFALPYEERRDPPIQAARIGEATWIFKSVSNDLRILGADLLDPTQVTGLNALGVPSLIVALSVGYGSNYLGALSVGGRLVLHNGSHRAYALGAAGQTMRRASSSMSHGTRRCGRSLEMVTP